MNILDKYFREGTKIHEKLQDVVLSDKQKQKLFERLDFHKVSPERLEEFEILTKLLKYRGDTMLDITDPVWEDQAKIFQLLTHTDGPLEDWPVKIEINGQLIEINSDLYRERIIQILKAGFQEEFKSRNFNLPEFRMLMDKIYDNTGNVKPWQRNPGPKEMDRVLQSHICIAFMYMTEHNIPRFQNHRMALISEMCEINDIEVSEDLVRKILRQRKLCK